MAGRPEDHVLKIYGAVFAKNLPVGLENQQKKLFKKPASCPVAEGIEANRKASRGKIVCLGQFYASCDQVVRIVRVKLLEASFDIFPRGRIIGDALFVKLPENLLKHRALVVLVAVGEKKVPAPLLVKLLFLPKCFGIALKRRVAVPINRKVLVPKIYFRVIKIRGYLPVRMGPFILNLDSP